VVEHVDALPTGTFSSAGTLHASTYSRLCD
jgi:hypothetical protein